MSDQTTLGDLLKQAASDKRLALGNHGTATIEIVCTDDTKIRLDPGDWCEVEWGEQGAFTRIISGPHKAH